MNKLHTRRLEIGGGQVIGPWPPAAASTRLQIPPCTQGYVDAQVDDYGRIPGSRRANYPWRPGVCLHINARFSHGVETLLGTAGFGFWNAPFGDPTVRRPALPQAVWFFYASAPNDLPLAPDGPGRGWFAATIHAASPAALAIMPLAPIVVAGNWSERIRRRLWPWVQRHLGISFAPLTVDMTAWHHYQLTWRPDGCTFAVDGRTWLNTSHSPAGPLGFVCWIDNQYMIVTPQGRLGAGTLVTTASQWLEVKELHLETDDGPAGPLIAGS